MMMSKKSKHSSMLQKRRKNELVNSIFHDAYISLSDPISDQLSITCYKTFIKVPLCIGNDTVPVQAMYFE